MKKYILITMMIGTITVMANDTLPILNTVFHGINTLFNVTKPTTIIIQQAVPARVVYPTVNTIYTTDKIVYHNNIIYIYRDNRYYRYVKPIYYLPPPNHYIRRPQKDHRRPIQKDYKRPPHKKHRHR